MNHAFKLVWSRSLGMLVPVPEVSRAVGHGERRRLARRAVQGAGLGALAVFAPLPAFALPQGGSVAAGTASISTNARTLTVNQSSSKAIINWQKFGVAPGESVNFRQPGTSSVALNRVLGNDPSQIFGHLTANGQIFLINPNGIVFAPGAQINVGGLVASTLDMTDQNFLSGNYQFSGVSTASVVNYGKIKTFDGGYVAFIGQNVDNEGLIKTPGGTAALGAGGSVALTLAGNSLVSFQVTTSALNAAVKNGGAIVAPNGVVLLTAQAKNALLQTVVNNTGLIQANGATSNGGVVTLLGGASGTVAVSGTIEANSTSGIGGTVVISGVNTAVSGTARLSATGSAGGGTIAIGGGVHGGGAIPQAVTTSVAAGAVVDASATGSGAGGTVSVWSDVTNPNSVTSVSGSILAKGAGTGAGGFVETSGHRLNTNAVTVQTGGGTWLLDPYNVTITSNSSNIGNPSSGGGSTNTFASSSQASTIKSSTIATALASGNVMIETAGTSSSNGNITVNTAITWHAGTILILDAAGNIVINAAISENTAVTPGSLDLLYGQASAGGADASYTINAPVNLSLGGDFVTKQGSTGPLIFYTIIDSLASITSLGGNYALGADIANSGNFSPIGTDSGHPFTGAFEGLGHTISGLSISESSTSNVGLFGYATGATIRDVGLVGESVAGNTQVGGLVGDLNGGTITDAYATGAVTGSYYVGGLVGFNQGTITDAYATGAVKGSSSNVGGLVGGNSGTISNAYATGQVAGGNVSGGLVGSNTGVINDAFAAGSVNATGHDFAGGLVGYAHGGTITDSYATASVTASSFVGGLIGKTQTATINDAYADGGVLGLADVGGLIGYNSNSGINGGVWDMTTSGQNTAVGAGTNQVITGLTTTALVASLPAGFAAGIWANAGDQTTPYLLANASLGGVGGSAYIGVDTAAKIYGVVQSMAQLQAINNNLSSNFLLAQNLTDTNHTGAGFTPIGNAFTGYTGVLDGLGHTISDLYINSAANDVGLFGQVDHAVVRNVGLDGGNVNGQGVVGALVGSNSNATISDVYATANVTGVAAVGGLIGLSTNSSSISNAYATGSVTGSGSVGGLVGFSSNTTIKDVYATGAVHGMTQNGGLVGYTSHTTITDGYWDVTTTGQTKGVGSTSQTGVTGLTTARWLNEGPVAENVFDTNTIWAAGYPYPVLKALPYIVITGSATQSQGSPFSGAVATSGVLNVALSGNITWISAAGTNSSIGSYQLGGSGLTVTGYQITYAGMDTVTAANTPFSGLSVPSSGSSVSGASSIPSPTSSVSSNSSDTGLSSTLPPASVFTPPSTTGYFGQQVRAEAAYGYLVMIGAGLGYEPSPFAGLATTPATAEFSPTNLVTGQFDLGYKGGGSNNFELLNIVDGGVNKPPS